MTITVNTEVIANAGADQTSCGTTLVYTCGNTVLAVIGREVAGTFSPNRNAANATYTPAVGEMGTFVILIWNVPRSDGTGPCTSHSDEMVLTVNNSAAANAGADQTTCGASSIILWCQYSHRW
jgi:hypothetical protein